MIEKLQSYLPGWAYALLLIVLSAALAGVLAYLAGGDVGTVVAAVLASVLGIGGLGAKSIGGGGGAPPPGSSGGQVSP